MTKANEDKAKKFAVGLIEMYELVMGANIVDSTGKKITLEQKLTFIFKGFYDEREAKDKKIEELKKQVEELDTKLSSEETRIVGIMHFVDKWIEIDDADKFGNIILQQDEVQRAQFVRQKTLEIMEEQAEEIESLKAKNTKLKELVGVYEEGFRKIKIMTAVSFTEIPHVEVITILQNLIKDMKDEAQTALDKGEQIKEK